MKIQLSEHFTFKKLLRFVYPSVIMMIFTSIYVVVDGLFVSNYVGKTAFAAINLISPFIMAMSALGFMMGTGGSAIVAKTLGEGKKEKAGEYFSMLVYVTLIGGIALSLVGIALTPSVARLLGASGDLLKNCTIYGRLGFITLAPFMLQNAFQSFFVAAEKPKLGLAVIVIAGVTNMILDYLFIAVFGWGIAGAAIATSCGELFGGFFPLIYFAGGRSDILRLGKTKFYGRILLKACANGSSELMTNLSSSIVGSLYNLQLMKLAGENGVAAYGTIMYANFIFVAVFFGYSIGSAPIISYHYGAANHDELKNLFKKGSGYIDRISDNIKEQMRAQMKENADVTYFVDDENNKFNFKSISNKTNFYVNEKGELTLVFDKYEVAPGYMGMVEFSIPTGEIVDMVTNGYLK